MVLTDGFSCRLQASDLGGAQGMHLAELLASRIDPTDRTTTPDLEDR